MATMSLLQDILRVLYPHAYESELTEMLRLVTKKRQVKGTGSVHHQLSELREIFAVYDEDGSGQLDQQEFLEALMAAGKASYSPLEPSYSCKFSLLAICHENLIDALLCIIATVTPANLLICLCTCTCVI